MSFATMVAVDADDLARPTTAPSAIFGRYAAISAADGESFATKESTVVVVTLSRAEASLSVAIHAGMEVLTPLGISAKALFFSSLVSRVLAASPETKPSVVEETAAVGSGSGNLPRAEPAFSAALPRASGILSVLNAVAATPRPILSAIT